MIVTQEFLYRCGGAAAFLGGLLRALASFIPYRSEVVELEALYAVIDVCILFGLFAIYLSCSKRIGSVGLIGFVISATCVASIIGPDPIIFGVNFYEVGASGLLFGLMLLSVQLLRHKTLKEPALLWIISLALAVCGTFLRENIIFIISGVSFGLAFVLSGYNLMRRGGNSPDIMA